MFSFGASLRKCVYFGVVAEFNRVFLFDLKSEFLEELWIRKFGIGVSGAAGMFCKPTGRS